MRAYQRIAQAITLDMINGKHDIDARLPAERELCIQYDVSRPVVREALISLEVQGFIEIRVGSRAFVRRIPGIEHNPAFAISAFELTEARRVFEGEAAALAALHISDVELAHLDRLASLMSSGEQSVDATEAADRDFHLLIARASRNLAVEITIEQLWQIRSSSPECVLLHDKACQQDVRHSELEHRFIIEALKSRNPERANRAMRKHLSSVMEQLLSATEANAIRHVKRDIENTRARFVDLTGRTQARGQPNG